MFNIPAITWTLTAVLMLGGTYHLVQALRSRHLADRVNNILHAIMDAVMIAMLWNAIPETTLAQIAVLAGAALWFIIQAIARPEFKLLCAGTQGRLKCGYHALTMTGAALMIAMMTSHNPAGGTAGGTATQASMPAHHAHDGMASTSQGATTTLLGPAPAPAILLTAFFAAAAAVFLFLLLRRRARPATRHTGKHSTPAGHAIEALGAGTMAFMFAAMAA